MARRGFAYRLYTGQISYDFIGHRRWWYLGSGLVLLVSVLSLALVGINPTIDFKGGAEFRFPTEGHSISDVRTLFGGLGLSDSVVQQAGSGSATSFIVDTKTLPEGELTTVEQSIQSKLGVPTKGLSSTSVGATWGGQITNKALESLAVFLVVVVAYLSIRFEPKMAFAAIVALIHDLVITAGIYSLSRFEVSPSTVIALLTILGYSLYDTVVVFDKVRENTQGLAGGSRMTFSDAANLAVNQTLVRSINTSVIALLPVAGLLIIGAGLLGAGSLKDLALALFIGLASGAYSSIFIATPLVCDLKEREPQFVALAKRVALSRSKQAVAPAATRGPEPAVAVAGVGAVEDPTTVPRAPAATRPAAGSRPRPAPPRRKGGRGRPGKKRRR
ncbi:MAG TPA: protein translocase subunit SecF [Mycobacteriales bacterium]|nr:protein translocase subunit SecF [Mycobacteriales bacterium]